MVHNEEPEPDWAPSMTVARPGQAPKVLAKGSEFYETFDSAAASSFSLMLHSGGVGGAFGDPTLRALRRWLGDGELDGPAQPPPFSEPPPRRSDYLRGDEGCRQYRDKRIEWYRNITRSVEHPEGLTLEGTIAEQNELFDAIARRFRQYTDR